MLASQDLGAAKGNQVSTWQNSKWDALCLNIFCSEKRENIIRTIWQDGVYSWHFLLVGYF